MILPASIDKMISDLDPGEVTYGKEYSTMFLKFCSYVCIIKNKKLNLPNIFLCLLKEPEIRQIFKILCDVETDYDALKYFLQYDPNLHRSKYIRNYITNNGLIVK